MEKKRERLLEQFPPLQREDWEERLEEECLALHQTPHLRSKTYEGIDVEPLYVSTDTETPFEVRRHILNGNSEAGSQAVPNAWEIRQDISVQDIPGANARALNMLANGANAIGFDLDGKEAADYADLQSLLKDIDPGKVALHWSGITNPASLVNALKKLADEKGVDPTSLRGSVLADPLGQLTLTGSFRQSFEKDMQGVSDLVTEFDGVFPGIRTVQVSAHHFVNAGASAVQELGYGLSLAAEYISWLTDQDIASEKIAANLQLNLGTGSHYFFEIAKLRAARILFATFLRSYGVAGADTASVHIQSITSEWNKTGYGSHVNMLRLTTESMAAVLGGCDSLLVRPFDSSFRVPGDFSERLARNLQIILREESYFDRVSDPAGGSYYIESITRTLCDRAWELFLETEDKGGYVAAFKEGLVQRSVYAIADLRRQKAALGKDTILGTNAFPDADELIAGILDADIAFKETAGDEKGLKGQATADRISSPMTSEPVAEPLTTSRVSVPFEKIRLAIEHRPAGKPKAFMLTFGNLHMRLARSQFSCNFFASAGYEVIDNLGFEDLDTGVEEALRMKSDLIVACSSDEEYEAAVPEIQNLLKGRAIVVVAGAPPSMEVLKEKGIRYFIHRNSNMIETFEAINSELGIKT